MVGLLTRGEREEGGVREHGEDGAVERRGDDVVSGPHDGVKRERVGLHHLVAETQIEAGRNDPQALGAREGADGVDRQVPRVVRIDEQERPLGDVTGLGDVVPVKQQRGIEHDLGPSATDLLHGIGAPLVPDKHRFQGAKPCCAFSAGLDLCSGRLTDAGRVGDGVVEAASEEDGVVVEDGVLDVPNLVAAKHE